VHLNPAYDIAMHLHHMRDNRRSALEVNGRYLMLDIDASDLVAEGTSWGLTPRRAQNPMLRTARTLVEALGEADPTEFPGVSEEAWAVVRECATRPADPVASGTVLGGTQGPGPIVC
jgi:serine/threonine-protein kinase HipA